MSLPENIAEPSFLVQLATEDTDYDEEGGITFSIPAEKYREIVSVDPDTGTVPTTLQSPVPFTL